MSIHQNLSQVPSPVHCCSDRRHKCGHAKCPVCQEWVSIQDHKRYIQTVVEDEEPEPTEEGGGCMVAPPPPLFVYANFEAMQNAGGRVCD